MEIQKTADLIIEINKTHENIIDVKGEINYTLSLKENRTPYPNLSRENFQFKSFDLDYLETTLSKLRDIQLDLEVEKIDANEDFDDDDYK